MSQPATPSQNTLRWTIIGITLALAALCIFWEAWLAPVRPGAWLLSLKALPLLLALPGMLAARLRTFQWWSMLSMAYLTEGLVRATTEQGLVVWLAWTEVALSTALFATVLLYCRNAKKVVPAAGGAPAKGSSI